MTVPLPPQGDTTWYDWATEIHNDVHALGTIATQAASSVAITGGTITSTSISGASTFNGTITGLSTDLAVLHGGTGASTAADARTNLGVLARGVMLMSIDGVLSAGTGIRRLYFPREVTIFNIWASVATAPTGSSLVFDVNVNGATICASVKPTITAGSFVDVSTTPSSQLVTAGQYVTVDVDSVGSTVAGSDAVIGIEYTEAY